MYLDFKKYIQKSLKSQRCLILWTWPALQSRSNFLWTGHFMRTCDMLLTCLRSTEVKTLRSEQMMGYLIAIENSSAYLVLGGNKSPLLDVKDSFEFHVHGQTDIQRWGLWGFYCKIRGEDDLPSPNWPQLTNGQTMKLNALRMYINPYGPIDTQIGMPWSLYGHFRLQWSLIEILDRGDALMYKFLVNKRLEWDWNESYWHACPYRHYIKTKLFFYCLLTSADVLCWQNSIVVDVHEIWRVLSILITMWLMYPVFILNLFYLWIHI